MKIGFVVECTQGGPDHKLVELLVRTFCPNDEPRVLPLNNKGILLKKASGEVAKLRKAGCDRVFVLFDWHPLEKKYQATHPKIWNPGICRVEAHELRGQLDAAEVKSGKVVVACVPQELEAWALADKAALIQVVSASARGGKFKKVKKTRNPEDVPNPVQSLENIFSYNSAVLSKFTDVPEIFKYAAQTRFTGLASCPTFCWLVEKLTNQTWEEAIKPPVMPKVTPKKAKQKKRK
ncbi:MAG: hypothetical protein ABJF10_21825 [Chthoniobacter sp.]|uniref:hypothetical protein n=1 Tax=Chthoniobacter sp. TaxID=2510640 RepID=UPI0032A38097